MQTTTRVHIAIPASDLKRSVRFYEALFGTSPSKTREGYAKFELNEPALHLALNAVSVPVEKPHDPNHFGVQVFGEDALSKLASRVDKAGLDSFKQEQTSCCYAVSDKVWVEDPDGHRWEIFRTTGESEQYVDSSASKTAERSCCAPDCCQEPASA